MVWTTPGESNVVKVNCAVTDSAETKVRVTARNEEGIPVGEGFMSEVT
jgi:hypothetical protein